jgi:probable phosphoglycerate mutase
VVLLRHGRTSWNDAGLAQGHADIGLDEVGHAEAAAAAPYLAAWTPAALWTSDLARAVQTAAYLERETGLAAKHDPRLREYDVGARQGLTSGEFRDRWPAEHAAWERGDRAPLVSGSESAADVEARMVPALRDCLDALPDGGVGVVVTHGAALTVGMLGLLGWPREHAASIRGLSNCGWVVLTEDGADRRLRLRAYNQRAEPTLAGPSTP